MSVSAVMAPSPAPHDRSSYADLAHPSPSSHLKSATKSTRTSLPTSLANHTDPRTDSKSPNSMPLKTSSSKKSPPILLRNVSTPQIVVKKKPLSSPEIRHRPRKLDLSANSPRSKSSACNDTMISLPPATSRPMPGQLTGRIDGLGIQEVGIACLSPGFNPQDPTRRENVQRSLSVRDQQRNLIEQRMNKQFAKVETPSSIEGAKQQQETAVNLMNGSSGSSKRRPIGLSIHPPPHEDFAQERVIQSAPLNQSFSMSQYHHAPLSRHVANHSSNLSNTSHIHHISKTSRTHSTVQHMPAIQSSNRLPPLMDVLGAEHLNHHESSKQRSSAMMPTSSTSNSSHSNSRPPFPSPGQPSSQPLPTSRPREYRSAEDAQVDISGGRLELLPRIIHYGGANHQPPTPPSPRHPRLLRQNDSSRSGGERRRGRAEFEDGDTPPIDQRNRSGPCLEKSDIPLSPKRKKRKFMSLCSEAWDLLHS